VNFTKEQEKVLSGNGSSSKLDKTLHTARDLLIEQSLPVNLDAERFVLGAIMTDESAFLQVAGKLAEDDFSLEKHRVIFRRTRDLHERSEKIDRITLANELMKYGELQSIDGLSYLVSLDDGLPQIYSLESYINIVKEKALLRRVINISQGLINRCLLGAEDPIQIIGAAEEALIGLSDVQSRTALSSPAQIIDEFEGGINAFLDTSKRIKGISTGFLKLDEMTGGLREGELVIVAARPAMGKTAFALNIAQHVATKLRYQKAVAIFSLEMSKESLLTRMLCAAARVDQSKFRAGYLNQEERIRLQEAAAEMYNAPLFIDDSAGTNLMDVHSKLRRLQAEHDLGLVIIDYLQLMQGPKRENRVQEVSALSRGVKLMSKDLRVPFVVLSQLSRASETRQGDHRPMLSDLRESGSIEQDADVVMFIFREEVYRPDKESLKGIAEILLSKQRNGPTGRVKLAFLNKFTKFENLAVDTGDEGSVPFD
jgi:replicative DNA helicase